MARIDLQQKNRSIWPWVVGLVGLVVIVWTIGELFTADGDEFEAEPAGVIVDSAGELPEVPGAAMESDAVRDFREECASASEVRDEMDESHSHERDCLVQLASALDASIEREAVGDEPLDERLDVLEQNAEALASDESATSHAPRLAEAMNEVIDVIEHVAETREPAVPGLDQEIASLRAAADDFGRSELMLDQKTAASEFFAQAANTIEIMNMTRGGQR